MNTKLGLSLTIISLISTNSFSQISENYSLIKPTPMGSIEKMNLDVSRNGFETTVFTQSEYTRSTPVGMKNMRSFDDAMANTKQFIVNVNQDGEYYFLANVMPANISTDENGNFNLQEISVAINGKHIGVLNTTAPKWQVVPLKNVEKIKLNKGQNIILFQSGGIHYPEVDCVQLTKDKDKLILKNTAFDNYVESLRNHEENAISTYSAFDNTGNFNVQPEWQYTPGANYSHMSKVPVVYTYFKKFHISNNEFHRFYTDPVKGDDYNSVNTVMHLFKVDDPHNYCWYNDDFDRLHSRIEANLPPGDYYLVVRSYNNFGASSSLGREGLVNVYDNGGIMNQDVPISGYVLNCGSNYTGALNYFTGRSSGTPKIWFMEGNSMKFASEEYTYYPPADFYWFDDARLKINFPKANSNIRILITSAGAWSVYFGNCDAYGGVPDVDASTLSQLPNLKSGDAIKSAENNIYYNSAAWAGGINTDIIWNSKWGSPFVWTTWDNYFGNNPARYSGAKTYSRSGGGNAVIAAFSKNGNVSQMSHFAVSRNANMQMHGYEWESKIGTLCRLFHPLNSIAGNTCGSFLQYYYDNQSPHTLSLQNEDDEFSLSESIENGLTTIVDVKLEDWQKDLINSYKAKARSTNALESYYEAWNAKIESAEYAMESNPYNFMENQESTDLINCARENLEESVLFLADKIFSSSDSTNIAKSLAPVLFCEIVKHKYGNIIEELKENWHFSSYTKSGSYIYPSPEMFTKEYVKSILNKNYVQGKSVNAINNSNASEEFKDNDKLFTVLPNPVSTSSQIRVELSDRSSICLKVLNGAGSVSEVLENKKVLDKGVYTYPININRLTTGINICTLEVDGKIYTRKILKQ